MGSVESGGQGERSSRSACTNSKAGNVSCGIICSVGDIDGISDLLVSEIPDSEVDVGIITELESCRRSSTTNEWDLVGIEVRSARGTLSTETENVVI